jgi:hypothetical protein
MAKAKRGADRANGDKRITADAGSARAEKRTRADSGGASAPTGR